VVKRLTKLGLSGSVFPNTKNNSLAGFSEFAVNLYIFLISGAMAAPTVTLSREEDENDAIADEIADEYGGVYRERTRSFFRGDQHRLIPILT
jgi:hypothetical protein